MPATARKTRPAPLTESEQIRAGEAESTTQAIGEVDALRPDAETAVAEVQDAARNLYAAIEGYIKVHQAADEIGRRRWGRRRRQGSVPDMDDLFALRKQIDRLVLNPPPLPLPAVRRLEEGGQ